MTANGLPAGHVPERPICHGTGTTYFRCGQRDHVTVPALALVALVSRPGLGAGLLRGV